jgi:succinate-acetate transporter protein
MTELREITIHDSTANPAPLGLMGFGLTTILLNIHNAGFTELDSMILAMGVFYGGLAQVIAGLLDFRKGNEFGATAFCSYGLFWLSLVALIVFPGWGMGDEPSDRAMGWYLFSWGVFTAIMFVGSLRTTMALQAVFFALTTLFLLLAIRDWTGSETIGEIAGWEGIATGLLAVYTATAQIWNDVYGRTVLPLGRARIRA